MISGLTKEKGNDLGAGVPGLRNLPGGRYVFGSTNKKVTMEEVLIFITPTILPTRTEADRQIRPLPQSPEILPFASEGDRTPASERHAASE